MEINCRIYFLLAVLVASLASAGCTQPGPAAPQDTPFMPGTPAAPDPVGPAATREELVAFVDEAVEYAREHGRDAALAEFSLPRGSFVRGELSIYAYDFNGTTLAHPVNPEKIGINRYDEQDASGTFFIRNLQGMAMNGSGFVMYSYINPAHGNAVEQKLGYVRRVDESWWLGSGSYVSTI